MDDTNNQSDYESDSDAAYVGDDADEVIDITPRNDDGLSFKAYLHTLHFSQDNIIKFSIIHKFKNILSPLRIRTQYCVTV